MFLVDMFVVSDLVLVVGCLMIRIAPVFVFNWSLEALYTQVVQVKSYEPSASHSDIVIFFLEP